MAAFRSSVALVLTIHLYILCFCNAHSTEYVPVFLWESTSDSLARKDVPALATVSADEFKDIVMQKLQNKPAVVIFAEENLSVEDFRWQDEAGEGAFVNLKNITSMSDGLTYLPFVHAPLRAFHHHTQLQGQDWHHLKVGPKGLSSNAIAANESLLFVNLDDATSDEDRPDLLKRHDAVISQVYKKLAEHHENILAVYTAHHSSWHSVEETLTRRVRHLLATDEGNTTISLKISDMLLYASSMNLIDNNGDPHKLIYDANGPGQRDNSSEVEISFKLDDTGESATIVFSFVEERGYWRLNNMSVTTKGYNTLLSPTQNIEAPMKFSYHCSQQVKFVSSDSKTYITASALQIQYTDKVEFVFDSSYDCVYFFTVPIWSGLFVISILAIIMTFGLCMIMDIRTMDRFDDPKGKTITINAGE